MLKELQKVICSESKDNNEKEHENDYELVAATNTKENHIISENNNPDCNVICLNNIPLEVEVKTDDICEICSEVIRLHDPNSCVIFDCNHSFCRSCVVEYFTYSISLNDLVKIKCLKKECNGKINDIRLQSLLEEATFNKFLLFSRKREIFIKNKELNRIQCPFPDCESYALPQNTFEDNDKTELVHSGKSAATVVRFRSYSDEDSFQTSQHPPQRMNTAQELHRNKIEQGLNSLNPPTFLTCEAGHKFCSKCFQMDWHVGRDCNSDGYCDFLNHIQNNLKDFKNCPSCGYWTEKMVGCNHIKCSKCQHNWCWLCLGEFTADHYSNPNSKCNGKLFEGSNIQLMNELNLAQLFQLAGEGEQAGGPEIGQPLEGPNENQRRRDDEWETIGYCSAVFTLYYYRNCFIRVLVVFLLLIAVALSNFAVMLVIFTHVDRTFGYMEKYRQKNGMRVTMRLIVLMLCFSFGVFTYVPGVLISIGMYYVPLMKYLCKRKRN